MKQYRQEIIDKINAIPIPQFVLDIKLDYIPLGDHIVIKKSEDDYFSGTTMMGGLIIPVKKSTYEHRGYIVALGPECSPYLKVGLLVNYNGMADISTLIDNVEYVLNRELSIEGIIGDSSKVVFTEEIPDNDTIDRQERKDSYTKGQSILAKDGENEKDAMIESRKKLIKKSPKKR